MELRVSFPIDNSQCSMQAGSMITPNCQLYLATVFLAESIPIQARSPTSKLIKIFASETYIAEWAVLISSAIDLLPEEAWTSSTASASLQVIQIHPFIARTVIEQV
jgi:hypothetical protein